MRTLPNRLRSLTATAAIAAVAVVLFASPALGASGATTLVLSGPAAKSLRDSGIRIAPVKPAKGGERRIVLPVRSGLAGESTTVLTHTGAISLRYQGRSARLSKLRLVLGKRSRMSAKLDGSSVEVFTVPGGRKRSVDPIAGTVELGGSRLKLTVAGARAIAAKLSQDVRPGYLGGIATRASGLAEGGSSQPGGGDAQQSSSCPLPSGAGPAPEDPPPVATPPSGALGVTSASIDWHVRESFIRYIATGEGTSVSGGATADPPVLLPGASAPLTYGFHFPFAKGWHDAGANPADPADDTAAIYFGGAVRFLYSSHGIDLTTAEPEIEIAGGASRAIFSVQEGADPAKRQVLVNLDLSRAAAVTASGNTHVYERVPGAIPSGTASSVFAGFYSPGTDFGCFTVRYTTS
ncbi:MAG TPA: HtaA domain-containing protein [Solirubrobacterales bacterium]